MATPIDVAILDYIVTPEMSCTSSSVFVLLLVFSNNSRNLHTMMNLEIISL